MLYEYSVSVTGEQQQQQQQQKENIKGKIVHITSHCCH